MLNLLLPKLETDKNLKGQGLDLPQDDRPTNSLKIHILCAMYKFVTVLSCIRTRSHFHISVIVRSCPVSLHIMLKKDLFFYNQGKHVIFY